MLLRGVIFVRQSFFILYNKNNYFIIPPAIIKPMDENEALFYNFTYRSTTPP